MTRIPSAIKLLGSKRRSARTSKCASSQPAAATELATVAQWRLHIWRTGCLLVMLLLMLQVANLHAKALEEDPTIFDYDSHFDTMQEQKVRPAMQEKIERKSRYIEALKDKAVQREREQNVVYERK